MLVRRSRCIARVSLVWMAACQMLGACQTSQSELAANGDDPSPSATLGSDVDHYGRIPPALQQTYDQQLALADAPAAPAAASEDGTAEEGALAAETGPAAVVPKPVVPQPGRYLGYVALHSQGAKAAAVLDLALEELHPDRIAFQGVLKVLAGGFDSHEYVSTYFPKVVYTLRDQQLDFGAGAGGGLSVAMATSTDKGLVGVLMHPQSEASGALELRWQRLQAVDIAVAQDVFAAMPPVNALSGSYAGTCPDNVVGLDVEASKWRGARGGDAGLFDGYRVNARLAQKDEVLCGGTEICAKVHYAAARYDFFSGHVVFGDETASLTCKQGARFLECGADCRLEKRASPPAAPAPYRMLPRPHHLQQLEQAAKSDLPPAPRELTGQFYGYLHHEQSDRLQLIALNLKTVEGEAGAPPGGPVDLKLSGVATLYFGEGDSNEFVAYKLAPTRYVHGKPFQVLSGPGDGFLALRRWNGGALAGEWYSKVYGRVGTVELQRDIVPVLNAAQKARLVQPLSGFYGGPDWSYELVASADVSQDEAEFYPLKLYGWAKEKGSEARRRVIEAGSFDFYTGSLAFRLDDGRTVVGSVDHGDAATQTLLWPPKPRFGVVLGERREQIFKKQSGAKPQQASLVSPTM
jgi:hypothetical protein